MFRTVITTAAWISLAIIAYATLCPLNERPEFDTDLSHYHISTMILRSR